MTHDAADALTTAGFDAIQRETLEASRRMWPMRTWRPSAIGHPCDRHLVWSWTRFKEAVPYDYVLESIFREGTLHQPRTMQHEERPASVYARLAEMGFEVVREQDRPIEYRLPDADALISGVPDGRIIGFRGQRIKPPVVMEAKSVQDYLWHQLHAAADFLASRLPHVRGYYTQVSVYCLLENTPDGVIVLKSKQTGLLKLIPVSLDFAFAESVLKRVERLQPMVTRRENPAPIPYEEAICGRCPFESSCYPARSFGDGATVLDDPAFLDDLERRDQLAPASREYEQLDKAVKDRLKREGVKFAVAGPFLIEGKVSTVHRKPTEASVSDVTRYEIRRV